MKIIKIVLRFLLILTALIFIALAVSYTVYRLNKKTSSDFLSSQFVVYGTIASIKNVYDASLDLTALHVILDNQENKNLKKQFAFFRSTSLSRNIFIRHILNTQADFQFFDDKSFFVAVDLGILTPLTQITPLIHYFFSFEGVDISMIKRNQNIYYEIRFANKATFYCMFRNNLFFFANYLDRLEKTDATYDSSSSLKFNEEIFDLKKQLPVKSPIHLFMNSNYFIQAVPFFNDATIKNEISWGNFTACSLFFNERSINLHIKTSIKSENQSINQFLNFPKTSSGIPAWLPSSTTVYASMTIDSIKNFYDIFYNLQTDITKRSIDKSISMLSLFNLTFDEAISWIGNEIGSFLLSGTDPVFFVKIADQESKNTFTKKITDSIFVDQKKSLILDDTLIQQIVCPDFLKFLLRIFVTDFNLTEPYFVEDNGFLYFSVHPDNLVAIITAKNENNVLIKKEQFVSAKIFRENLLNSKSNIRAFYALQKAEIPFIPPKSLFAKIISLYDSGLCTINLSAKDISVNLSLAGIAKPPVENVVGFPVMLNKAIFKTAVNHDVYMGKLSTTKSKTNQLVYLDENANIQLLDLFGKTIKTAATEKNARLAVYARNGTNYVVVFNQQGILLVYTDELQLLEGFPVSIPELKTSFFPLFYDNSSLLFFHSAKKQFVTYSLFSHELKNLPCIFDFDILSPPDITRDFIACAPRNLYGDVFLLQKDGNPVENWPVEGDGNPVSQPVIVEDNKQIVFLTQKGILNVWDFAAQPANDFPLDLQGNYFVPPQIFTIKRNTKAIFVIDSKAQAKIISLAGKVLAEKKLPVVVNRDLSVTVQDVNNDGKDELFLYGSANIISAFNSDLTVLDGFPISGNSKPYFIDFDNDKTLEIFSVGIEGNLYAKKIR